MRASEAFPWTVERQGVGRRGLTSTLCRGTQSADVIRTEPQQSTVLRVFTAVICLVSALHADTVLSAEGDYDPLNVTTVESKPVDLEPLDPKRGRTVPIRIFLPPQSKPSPVILFSHGLGGSREGNAYLGKHWSARGYVVVFVQHPGSDESVWKDVPLLQRMQAMRKAASGRNLVLRCEDIRFVLDQLEQWNSDTSSRLHGRVDMSKVGMSGHSFGAHTTQAVSGQTFGPLGQRYTDPRIRAAVAFSPGSATGGNQDRAFGSVSVPWMLMTGTRDTAPVGNQTVESRREVYPALPPSIAKYELVLFDGAHSAFSEGRRPGEGGSQNPNHHRVILALTTAFWDTWLKEDSAARNWLHGDGPKNLRESKDEWQFEPGPEPKKLDGTPERPRPSVVK
ncbi:MAG: dienelactone hydrolase [Planctomycetaceae bacterium]|nr:dienelactone hydrolase [Planctomycetaceae bacterium]